MKLTDTEVNALIDKYEMVREDIRQQKRLGNQRVTQGVAVLGLILAYSAYADNPVLLVLLPLFVSLIIALVITSVNEFLLLSWKALELEKKIQIDGFDYEIQFGPLNDGNKLSQFSEWYTVPWVVIMMIAIFMYLVSIIAPFLIPQIWNGFTPQLILALGISYAILTLFTALSIISFLQTSRTIVGVLDGDDVGWLGILAKLLRES